MASFSCYKSDDSSCPTTPQSNVSELTPTGQREREDAEDAYYALQNENTILRKELDLIAERLEELQRCVDESQHHQQQQSHRQWIAENLEEAQQLIDIIVGIKGITEDPLGAAVKMGISHEYYHQTQQQLPRVSISSSIVPSNEELYGY
jgi:hypothetical protein